MASLRAGGPGVMVLVRMQHAHAARRKLMLALAWLLAILGVAMLVGGLMHK